MKPSSWPLLLDDVHHPLQLLPGAHLAPIVQVPSVEHQRGKFCLDSVDDRLENQREEQASNRVTLMEAKAGEDDKLAKDQFSI